MNNQDTDKYTVIFDGLRTPSPRAETHDCDGRGNHSIADEVIE
jgi:hypothetical protein